MAVVENTMIRIDIARPGIYERRADAQSQVGYYAWRVSVNAPEPFTLVLMSDTAMRSTNLREILRASTLRMCPSAAPDSLLDCTIPIRARTDLRTDEFSLIISDKDFVNRIRRERPQLYTRSRIEPRGRIQVATKAWRYADSGRP